MAVIWPAGQDLLALPGHLQIRPMRSCEELALPSPYAREYL
jgi:hypothetical protein